jgi:hypothetical protein
MEATKLETLMGGKMVTVTLREGAKEEITVQQLAVAQMPRLLAVMEDEAAMVELFCGKPKGWAVTLTPEAHEEIVTEGERLNADFFGRWVQRQLQRRERLVPGITQAMQSTVLSSLRTGSPSSPSSPASV